MYEYSAKFSHGIYPMVPRSRIYERADLFFASAVREYASRRSRHRSSNWGTKPRTMTENS